MYGAAGHTGRFVVKELLRRGLTPVAVSRGGATPVGSPEDPSRVALRSASVDDPAALDRVFADVAAVINCAGPFLDTADQVVSAALRRGIHYLDLTAEQLSAQRTLETWDAPARDAGVMILPAMGFYGGLSDLLVTAAKGDWASLDEVRIGIALDRWHPTRGTRRTSLRNTAPRLIVADGRLVPLPHPAPETSWDFAEPFGRLEVTELAFSEVMLIARHLHTAQLHTYLNRAALRDVRGPESPEPRAADESGRSSQIFLVEVIVRKGGNTRRARARGRDIYAFTAPLVCEAVERILDGRVTASGACAPGAVFDAESYLRALTPRVLTLGLET